MTTFFPSPTADPSLEELHEEWVEAVRSALAPVTLPESGIWERWAAIQFLERHFLPRFERELEPVNRLVEPLPPGEAARVWMPAELLGFLHAHLVELVRLAQSGGPFSVAARKFIKAHECWCREVDALVAALSVAPMTAQVEAALRQLQAAAQGDVLIPG